MKVELRYNGSRVATQGQGHDVQLIQNSSSSRSMSLYICQLLQHTRRSPFEMKMEPSVPFACSAWERAPRHKIVAGPTIFEILKRSVEPKNAMKHKIVNKDVKSGIHRTKRNQHLKHKITTGPTKLKGCKIEIHGKRLNSITCSA